jgi:hypothetical protein
MIIGAAEYDASRIPAPECDDVVSSVQVFIVEAPAMNPSRIFLFFFSTSESNRILR